MSKKKTKEFINILLLGETGVGKSTFLNSFVNYINFKKFEIAEQENPICVIPTKITLFDDEMNERVIKIGEDNNEFMEVGASATQGKFFHEF